MQNDAAVQISLPLVPAFIMTGMGISDAIYSLVMFANGGLLIAWNTTRRAATPEVA